MVYMFLIVIGILVVVMCIMACLTKDKEPVPMNDIEGREIETVSEFEFGW